MKAHQRSMSRKRERLYIQNGRITNDIKKICKQQANNFAVGTY